MTNVTFQKICSCTYDGGIDLEHGSTMVRDEKVLDNTSSAAELYDSVTRQRVPTDWRSPNTTIS